MLWWDAGFEVFRYWVFVYGFLVRKCELGFNLGSLVVGL